MDGTEYPPNTLREILIMIQMYLHENGVYCKVLDGDQFTGLRNILDNTMKQRTAMGLGAKVSSEVISIELESKMFKENVLGEDTPVKLLQTMIYMLGMHLALRGGVEHTRLRRPGFSCQINVEYDDKGRERLVYREDPCKRTTKENRWS